jgi:hypothetical protein
MTNTNPARTALYGDRVILIKDYTGAGQVYFYDPAAMTDGYAPEAEVIQPEAGQRVRLTAAQRTVALYRFEDVATAEDDFGAVLEGDVLVITDACEALETLDAAAELCDDAAEGGMPGRRREAATTRRLRAKVYAAIVGK